MSDYMAAVAFGIDFGDEEIDDDLSAAIDAPDSPVQILGYGVDFEYCALVLKETVIEGDDGEATEFKTAITAEQIETFKAWCNANDIVEEEPKWLLTVAIGT